MVFYDRGKNMFFDPDVSPVGEAPFSLLLDRIVIGLMKTSYSINAATDLDYDDISASGIVATNYVEPGNASSHALGTKAVNINSNRAEFDAADLVLTALGGGANDTFDQLIVAREQDASVTEANTMLLAHTTVASTLTNGTDVTFVWSANGILQLTD